MSVRWMAVQYLGDTLRLPVVNQSDLHKPFGMSVLERDIRRIVVNPLSDNPVTFVPESENAKLRELVRDIDEVADPYLWEFIGRRKKALGIEMDE